MSASTSDTEKQQFNRLDGGTTPPESSSQDVSSPENLAPAPDGGLEAWLVVAGSSCIFFAGLGFANSSGVFIEYYLSHQLRGRNADDVAWIASLSNFIQFASGVVGGPLFDRYGAWVIRPAALIYLIAVMMTSLCHEYWQFMLAQGLLLGIGMGGLMFPAMAAVSQYFDKKRAAALGLTVAGSSVGGVVIPIAFSKLLNSTSVGFGWSVRIVGFIMAPMLAFSCFAVKSRLPPKMSAFLEPAAFKSLNFCLITIGMFFMMLGVFTPLFYIPTFAVHVIHMDPTLASYLLAIMNASATFGRIIPGILADKLGPLNIVSFAGVATGVIICCMSQADTTAKLVVYSIFFGFCSGTVISGGSAALAATVKDPRKLGTYLGMGMCAASVGVLIGPPINGRLLDDYGFLELGLFSGIVCLAGGFIALASKAASEGGILARI